MKHSFYLKKSKCLLLALLAVIAGSASPIWAETMTETFDNVTVTSRYLLSNGWVMVHNGGNYQGFGGSYDYQIKSGNYDGESGNSLSCDYSDNNEYVVIPTKLCGTFTYYVKRSSSSNGTVTFFEATKDGDDFTVTSTQLASTSTSSAWASKSFELGDEGKYVAIRLTKSRIDQITATVYEDAEGPALVVKDGETKLTSGYNYDFGVAAAGTTKTFTLANPGTADLTVEISETGYYNATLSATTIAAGSEVTLTVTMPSTSAGYSTGSEITITPADGSGIENFILNVVGVVRDMNKVYESGFTALPEDWTTTGSWYYSEANGAYTTVWYLTSEARLITPLLNISEDEIFFVEAKGYSTSNTSYQHLQMQYSADGTTWTNFDSEPELDPSNWQTFSFTGVPAGKYYIAINASQADIRMFYGGELPQEPKMVVTQPESLDFGVIAEATVKTFTIANTGLATLEGINVTSSNSSIFSITGAPTSLAAGESAEVTITMAATTTGALSSDITVSATGMEDVQFTVTGVVLPEGLMVVDFNGGLPEKWSNSGWTFNEGMATGKSSSSQLFTPILRFTEGDIVAIKAQCTDNDKSDYLRIIGSDDNGSTWTAYDKKINGGSGLAFYKDGWGTIVLTDIPTTVTVLKFVGYYVNIDEIAGLTYAPILEVDKDGQGFASPAYHHFGECSDDAAVTFNFTNYGGGTITITNVAITGEGAAAYSTNWTESVEVPFDLVISRTYNSERTGVSEAVVTVTTTEGDFIINVDGSDKGLNAPELAISPAEDAAFGVVTEAVGKTYTVTNAGTGMLSVDIASDNEMFTVSAESLENIAAGESKTFDVTFTPTADIYGTFFANITVTPTYDKEAVATIVASATVKDPNVWREDFSAGVAPTGWDAGANWSFTNGVAKAAYAYGTTNYLTTPALTVADAKEELNFDYKATANYVSIKIQMSKDGGAFADFQTISGLNNGDAGTYTITGLEAGDYQFRFANDDYELDNFEGFKLNLPDHIATITASTIPASSSWSMTMKEGRSFEATVTVKEMRGVAEELTAKFYMGEEVIGAAKGTVAANSSETLTITCTPTTAATEGTQMHIEVEYAGGTLATEPVTRYVAALTYLTLDETSSEAVVAGTYDNVTLKRTFADGWNTVCLPFTISDVEDFFGTGAKAFEFNSFTDGNLGFTTVTTLTASYPYIVYVPAAITKDIELTDITIASNDADPWYTRKDNAYFRGTYAPIAAGEWGANGVVYGVTADGHIQKAGANANIKGFRAYFDIPAGTEVKALNIGDEATGINLTPALSESEGAIYNLSGQRIQKLQKGINIINGKKILK